MASSALLLGHYPCPGRHGNAKASGRAPRSRALNREGDQLAVPAVRPCQLHCTGPVSLLAATYSLCAPRRSLSPPPALDSTLPPTAPPFPVPLRRVPQDARLAPRLAPGAPSRLLSPWARQSSAGWGRGPERSRRPSCSSGFRAQREYPSAD